MTEWKEYTGSDEQIAEIKNANHGYTLRRLSGEDVMFLSVEKRPNLDNVTHYLIWNSHPLADMICQQARTGQPVYVQYAKPTKDGLSMEWVIFRTTTPNWNIPNAEYSFSPFEKEIEFKEEVCGY